MEVRTWAEVPGDAPTRRDSRRCRGGGVWRRGRLAAGADDSHVGESTPVRRGIERGEAGEPWSGACCSVTTPRSRLQRQMRRAAACACATSHSQPCLPGSVVPSRQSVLDGGRRALSPITEHRNVETRTGWIVQEPMVGLCLPKPTVRQSYHAPRGHHEPCKWGPHCGNLQGSPHLSSTHRLYATLHSHQMGRPSFLGSRASALRPAYRWLAREAVSCSRCVGEAFPAQDVWEALPPVERRKGQHRAKATRVGRRHGRPGPPLRLVRPPRVWRRRHGDLPGQGAGHLPRRVSRPVSRCHVAVGGTVSTAAAAPPRDLASVPRRPQLRGRIEGEYTCMIQRSGHPTVPAGHARRTALSVRGAPSVDRWQTFAQNSR